AGAGAAVLVPLHGCPHRAAVLDPAEEQLALLVAGGAVLEVEAEVAIPGAHQPIEGPGLVPYRGIRIRRRQGRMRSCWRHSFPLTRNGKVVSGCPDRLAVSC